MNDSKIQSAILTQSNTFYEASYIPRNVTKLKYHVEGNFGTAKIRILTKVKELADTTTWQPITYRLGGESVEAIKITESCGSSDIIRDVNDTLVRFELEGATVTTNIKLVLIFS